MKVHKDEEKRWQIWINKFMAKNGRRSTGIDGFADMIADEPLRWCGKYPGSLVHADLQGDGVECVHSRSTPLRS
jgi:hypothetical protein